MSSANRVVEEIEVGVMVATQVASSGANKVTQHVVCAHMFWC
jgi:hypothetical protein